MDEIINGGELYRFVLLIHRRLKQAIFKDALEQKPADGPSAEGASEDEFFVNESGGESLDSTAVQVMEWGPASSDFLDSMTRRLMEYMCDFEQLAQAADR